MQKWRKTIPRSPSNFPGLKRCWNFGEGFKGRTEPPQGSKLGVSLEPKPTLGWIIWVLSCLLPFQPLPSSWQREEGEEKGEGEDRGLSITDSDGLFPAVEGIPQQILHYPRAPSVALMGQPPAALAPDPLVPSRPFSLKFSTTRSEKIPNPKAIPPQSRLPRLIPPRSSSNRPRHEESRR